MCNNEHMEKCVLSFLVNLKEAVVIFDVGLELFFESIIFSLTHLDLLFHLNQFNQKAHVVLKYWLVKRCRRKRRLKSRLQTFNVVGEIE